jgi:hypothetical protein
MRLGKESAGSTWKMMEETSPEAGLAHAEAAQQQQQL